MNPIESTGAPPPASERHEKGWQMMLCPECGTEYREGSFLCDRCGASLNPEPPSYQGEPMVAVLRSADAALLPVLKSVLAAAEIPFRVHGDGASGLYPLGNTGLEPDGFGLAAVIFVPESRADEASELLESSASDGESE